MKLISHFFMMLFLLLYMDGSIAQVRTKGTVVTIWDSMTNQRIVNVSVKVVSSNIYIKEFKQGAFLVPEQSGTEMLEIKHVGYKSQLVAITKGMDSLKVSLTKEMHVLEDVFVQTGYESISAKRNTGAVEMIDSKMFNRSTGPDLLRRLTGVSTILFNDWNTNINRSSASPKITIRGETSLLSDASPLIILDNFPYEGHLEDINLDDVENVNILKDAASSAIWGARAGNGVIVITTKKGEYNTPLSFDFSSTFRLSERPNLFYLPTIASADYIEVERLLFANKYFDKAENSTARTALSPAVELMILHRDRVIGENELNAALADLGKYDVRKDFTDYVYRKEVYQRHNVAAKGGNETFRFRLSAGYDRNLSNTHGKTDHKISVRSDNELKISKQFSAQLGLSYANIQNSTDGLIQYGNLRAGGRELYPYARLVDEDGVPASIAKDYRTSYTASAGNGRLLDWNYVPLKELIQGGQKNNDLMLNFGLRYCLTHNISAEVKYNYQYDNRVSNYLEDINYYETRNMINRFTEINGEQVKYNFPFGGVLSETDILSINLGGRLQLNWSPTFDKHMLTMLGGAEVRQAGMRLSQHNTYGYDGDRLTSSPMDFINYYQTFENIGGKSLLASNPSSFEETLFRDVSFFGNSIYSYDNRYVFSLNIRKDASNLLGMKTNERWKPLWSVSGAWNVSDESWFDVKGVEKIKIRMSHGYSGNIDKSKSAHTILRFDGRYHLTQFPYATILNPPNPDLQWETVVTTNLGLELGFLRDRLRISVDAYKKNTTNLLGMAPIDPTTGFSTMVMNNAKTKGIGVEVSIISKNVNSEQFKWHTSLLFAYNQTKVAKWLNPLSTAGGYVGNGRSLSPYEGNLLYSLYSFKWNGLNPSNGNPIGELKSERTEDYRAIRRESEFEDLVYHGSGIPLYHGSLLNSFTYRKIVLSANIGFRAGYYFRKNAISYQDLFSGVTTHREYSDRWQKAGDELITNVPSLVYPANSERDEFYYKSEVNVAKADHVRLLDMRVDYTVNSRLQVFANVGNVGIIWRSNKWGLDPDVANNIPQPRNYGGGLSFKF